MNFTGSALRRVAEDEAMEVEEFDEIEKLQHQGINAGDIKKLKDAGVHTIQGLQMIPKRVCTVGEN